MIAIHRTLLIAALCVSPLASGHEHKHDHHHDHAPQDAHAHDHDRAPGDQPREHGAHVHGVAWLDVALDGARLEIGLKGTGADLAGLEGAPADATDVAKVETARRTLSNPGLLFAIEPADACRIDGEGRVEPPASALKPPPGADAEDPAHDHSHGDWSATYAFTCTTPPAAVTLPLFDRYPDLTEVRAQILTPALQTAAEATPAQRRITLAGPR